MFPGLHGNGSYNPMRMNENSGILHKETCHNGEDTEAVVEDMAFVGNHRALRPGLVGAGSSIVKQVRVASDAVGFTIDR
jgi:hypothetical protein